MTDLAEDSGRPAGVTVSTRTSPLLAIALLAGLYLMVGLIVLLGAIMFLPVILGLGGHVDTAVMGVTEFLAVGSVPGLMLIYYSVFALRRLDDQTPAAEVAPGDAPRLWEAVTEVADAAGTRPPDKLRVAAMANAAVFEETRLLGFAGGQRSLTIGMPLLVGMTAAELRAVLAHEMGHYARGHTRLGAQVYRGSVALRNTCQALIAAREPDTHRRALRAVRRIGSLYAYIAYGVFAPYSAFYDRVSFAARRRQELQADACAADNFGQRVTADALREAHALPTAWSRFHDGYLEPMRLAGYLPDEPFSAFEAMLDDPDYRDVLAKLRQSPPEQPVTRLDSHPPLSQRLAVLAARPAGRDAAPAGPAISGAMDLLSDDERRSISLGIRREMFGDRAACRRNGCQDLPWREWVSTAATFRAAAPAAALVQAAGRLAGQDTATLDTALDLLSAGQAGDLAAALAQDLGESPDAGPALLAAALYALAGHYLVTTGRAEWAVSWTGPSRLIAADVAADELYELVSGAVQHPATEVSRLRLHLASLRLDPAATGPASALRDGTWRPRPAGPARSGRAGHVRIRTDADPMASQRVRAIQVSTKLVGIVGGLVVLIGTLSWHHAHSYASFVPSQPPVTLPIGGQPQIPDPLPTLGAEPGISPFPIPIPTLPFPKLKLATSIVVKPGDSLGSIACRYQTTVRTLQKLNHLGRSTSIAAGQRLRVPNFGIFSITENCG